MTSRDLSKVLRQNVRSYGMYIALVVIIVIFTILTNGLFISSRNISNLLNQAGYIAVLAVGMTLVIVIRHIDLSVGFLSGFLGAIAAISLAYWHFPVYLSILLVLALGMVAGLVQEVADVARRDEQAVGQDGEDRDDDDQRDVHSVAADILAKNLCQIS